MTEFTPLQAIVGGGLIGLASVLLMLTIGRIMGGTGILAGLLQPASRPDFAWRAALVAGMVSGPVLIWLITGHRAEVTLPQGVGTPALIVGGLIVGIGATVGSGCTSGHGVCGLARLSPRSIAATASFMAGCAATVYVIRHVIGV